jgi:hypothetical protein
MIYLLMSFAILFGNKASPCFVNGSYFFIPEIEIPKISVFTQAPLRGEAAMIFSSSGFIYEARREVRKPCLIESGLVAA